MRRVNGDNKFNLGFVTDLCVIFGPCHIANVAIALIKRVRNLYLNMLIGLITLCPPMVRPILTVPTWGLDFVTLPTL